MYNKRVLIWRFILVFMKSYGWNWQINCNSRNWRNQMTEQYQTIGPEIQGFISDRRSFYRTCPSVRRYFVFTGDAVHQPTWPVLLKIEHMVKLQVLGNNSKTVNNIKNLTYGKNDQHSKIYIPCNFEVNLITHLGVIALFSSNILNFQTFCLIFQKL